MIDPIRKFYPSDKELYDFLKVQEKEFTKEFLLDFLSYRGVILSDKCSRSHIIEYLIERGVCSNSLRQLYMQYKDRDRKKKQLFVNTLDVAIEKSMLLHRLKKVAGQLSSKGETLKTKEIAGNQIKITIIYKYLDHARSRMFQVRERVVEGLIEIKKDSLSIKMPPEPKSEEFISALDAEINSNEGCERSEFVLTSIKRRDLYNKFFFKLANNITHFEFKELVKVKFSNKEEKPDEEEFQANDLERVASALIRGRDLQLDDYVKKLITCCRISQFRWKSICKLKDEDIRNYSNLPSFQHRVENELESREFEFEIRVSNPVKGLGYTINPSLCQSYKFSGRQYLGLSIMKGIDDLLKNALANLIQDASYCTLGDIANGR